MSRNSRPFPAPLARRHPLFKSILGGGMLLAFLLLPDRSLPAVAAKLSLLAAVFFLSGGPGRRAAFLRGGLALGGFLAVFLLCSFLGDAVSGGSSLDLFPLLALKSFWSLSVSLLLAGTISFAECVYLSRILRIPSRISAQILLILLIGRKIAREFARVPVAWRSRGLSSRCLRRHPARAAGLINLLLLRVVVQGGRLEKALLGRGFSGRFYTRFSASWSGADSFALLGFLLAGAALILVSTGRAGG